MSALIYDKHERRGMREPVFYEPVARGLEIRIRERLGELRELNRKARG